jgi:hypothetical protein
MGRMKNKGRVSIRGPPRKTRALITCVSLGETQGQTSIEDSVRINRDSAEAHEEYDRLKASQALSYCTESFVKNEGSRDGAPG